MAEQLPQGVGERRSTQAAPVSLHGMTIDDILSLLPSFASSLVAAEPAEASSSLEDETPRASQDSSQPSHDEDPNKPQAVEKDTTPSSPAHVSAIPRACMQYSVQPSDTLRSIAIKFGMTTAQIIKLNRLQCDVVFAGESIFVKDPNSSESLDLDIPKPKPSPSHPSKATTISASASASPSASAVSRTAARPQRVQRSWTFGGWMKRNWTGAPLSAVSKSQSPRRVSRSVQDPGMPFDAHVADTFPRDYLSDTRLSPHEFINEHCLRLHVMLVTNGEGVIPGIIQATQDSIAFYPQRVAVVRELGPARFTFDLEMGDMVQPRTQLEGPDFRSDRRALLPPGKHHLQIGTSCATRAEKMTQSQTELHRLQGGVGAGLDESSGSLQDLLSGQPDAQEQKKDTQNEDKQQDEQAEEGKEEEEEEEVKGEQTQPEEEGEEEQAKAEEAQKEEEEEEKEEEEETAASSFKRRLCPSSQEDYPVYLELRLQLIFSVPPSVNNVQSYWLAVSRGRIDAIYDFVALHCQADKKWDIAQAADAEASSNIPIAELEAKLASSPRPLPKMMEGSKFLTPPMMAAVIQYLPRWQSMLDWTLAYATYRDGISLPTFYRCASEHPGPSVLAIRDSEGAVFGAYVTETWELNESFYGTGQSFLFQLAPKQVIYPWTGMNSYVMMGRTDGLVVGGGGGKFGLFVGGNFLDGSSHSCSAFANQTLSSKSQFQIHDVELWSIITM